MFLAPTIGILSSMMLSDEDYSRIDIKSLVMLHRFVLQTVIQGVSTVPGMKCCTCRRSVAQSFRKHLHRCNAITSEPMHALIGIIHSFIHQGNTATILDVECKLVMNRYLTYTFRVLTVEKHFIVFPRRSTLSIQTRRYNCRSPC